MFTLLQKLPWIDPPLETIKTLSTGEKPQILHVGYLDVSKNRGTPKSSILIGFSIINHPFWGTPIFGNTHLASSGVLLLRFVFGLTISVRNSTEIK